jgi:hypothetical protein
MQASLVEVTGQDGDAGLNLHRHVGERLTGRRAERADHPDLVGVPGHRGPPSGICRDWTMLAAVGCVGIIQRR